MKGLKITLLTIMVLVFTLVLTNADGQLLKNLIKVKGGGGSDISKLISYIPEDAQLLLSINWENLSKTDLVDMIKSQLGEDFQIIEAMGIDIKNDVKHAILGITFAEQPMAYGIIAGKFDEAKIMKTFEDQGAEVETKTIGKAKVYSIEGLYFVFKPEGVLFAASEGEGTEEAFENMLNVGEKNLANNPAMSKLVQDTDTSATAWGVFVIPEQLKEEMKGDSEEIPFDVDTLQSIGGSLNYAEKISMKGAVYFNKDGEAAKLNKFLGEQLTKLTPEENPNMPAGVFEILKTLKLTAEPKVFRASISATLDQLKPLIGEITGTPVEGEKEEEEGEEWGEEEGTETEKEGEEIEEESKEKEKEEGDDEWGEDEGEEEKEDEDTNEDEEDDDWGE